MIGRYLVSYIPYSHKTINGFYKIVAETKKYWKGFIREDCYLYVDKKSLCERGSDSYNPFEIWESWQVVAYVEKRKLIKQVKEIEFEKLDSVKLKQILQIING